ncbi:MAG: hypothetical protein Q4D98_08395 [Planctomycetia bacterium]|nr:hypothetical protein [Planctomycetia bacterium]
MRNVGLPLLLFLSVWVGCREESKTDLPSVPVHRVDITPDPRFRPTLAVSLPDSCTVPDGMTLSDDGVIYLNIPNYAPRDRKGRKVHGALLGKIDRENRFEVLLEYPVHPQSGEAGPMGLDFGPDGNLYVCDNQFFVPPTGSVASRILRVEMKDGQPTGKVETVVDGLRLANALLWHDGVLYVTDTQIPTEEYGCGGIWRFTQEELAGTASPWVVRPAGDPHLVATCPVKKIGREDHSGLDGLTWAWGALYCGNFGDGVMFRVTFDAAGKASVETVLDDASVHCCDGIFYDAGTDKIYICDSQANAIRTLDRNHVPGWLWVNDDTNGEDGLLDQPAECLVRDGVLYVANFDWAFPGLKNTVSTDKPYTISAISLEKEGKK